MDEDNKAIQMLFRAKPDVRAWIEAESKETERSMTAVINRAIRAAMRASVRERVVAQ